MMLEDLEKMIGRFTCDGLLAVTELVDENSEKVLFLLRLPVEKLIDESEGLGANVGKEVL